VYRAFMEIPQELAGRHLSITVCKGWYLPRNKP
jgi:hypothetical protein